jgi:hypothetical protein
MELSGNKGYLKCGSQIQKRSVDHNEFLFTWEELI